MTIDEFSDLDGMLVKPLKTLQQLRPLIFGEI